MADANERLAGLARVHAERAIARLAAILDAPGVTTAARIDAARVLLGLAAARPARMRRAVRIDWAEPGGAAPAAAVDDASDRNSEHCAASLTSPAKSG